LQRKSEDVRRQAAEEMDRRRDIGEAQDEERHRLAHADELQKDHRRQRSADHTDVAKRVDRGDNARAPIDARPGLNRGEQWNNIEAQGRREEKNFNGKAHASGAHEKFGYRNFLAGGRNRVGGQPDVDRQRRDRQQKEWCGRKLDPPMRQDSRGERPRGDADREDKVDRDFDIDPAADARLDDHRQQRQGDRADRPEPAHPKRADPLPAVGVDLADHGEGRGEDILADLESRCADSGRRDGPRRDVAADSNQHELSGHARRRTALRRGEAAKHEATDDRDESCALDQRIAGDEFFAPKMIRQNAVFDRAEQRCD
jgi:hypothetical protein